MILKIRSSDFPWKVSFTTELKPNESDISIQEYEIEISSETPINFLFLPLRNKHRAINDIVDKLEFELMLFEPNPKSEGFDDFIDELVSLFDTKSSWK